MWRLGGLFYVVWRHPLADIALRAQSGQADVPPFDTCHRRALGQAMAMVGLDACSTSMLILLFFYLGVIARQRV